MSRRKGALIVAIGLAAGLVGGCGIPDHTEVQVDRGGPVAGADQQPDTADQPKKRLEAATPEEFVRNFLKAAAGEFDVGGPTSRRLQDFVTGDQARNVSLAEGEVAVVRVGKVAVDKDGLGVGVDVQQVGKLNAAGSLLAPTEIATHYDLRLREESGGWRLTKVPGVVLLDVTALENYYTERTVYFWNTDNTALVPDLRWLPNEVPMSRVPTELLAMIEGGPSHWLEGVASPLPKDSKLLINAPLDNGVLTMNWSPSAIDNDAGDFLAQQVAWTVRGLSVRSLQLKINGQVVGPPYDDIQALVLRTRYPVGPQPHAYAIVDGKIRALGQPAGTPAPVPLADPINKGLQWAAFNRTDGGMDAAVVTGGELRVGSVTGDTVVEAVAGTAPKIKPTSPPVWLPRSRTGLVTTDAGLYAFGPGRTVSKPGKALADITAVAAAPDGQRIAVIAGPANDPKLYVMAVSVTQEGAVTFEEPRKLDSSLTNLTAVAWSSETTLSVGGTDENKRLSIVDVTVDGARSTPRIYDAQGPITAIAAYPENTVLGLSTTLLYQADNLAFQAMGSSRQLGRAALDGESATPSQNDDEHQPTAPFFVY